MMVNNQYRGNGSHGRIFVYFLPATIDVSSPYIEKWFHLTSKFSQDASSADTLCGTKQPINRNTLFDEETLDEIERLIRMPQPQPFDIQFCEYCVEKAFAMKREEEKIEARGGNEL
jgi:hypothetical protein